MLFQTHVEVPEWVIKKIALEIKEKFFEEMLIDHHFDYLSKGCRMYNLGMKYNKVVDDFTENYTPEYQGYRVSMGSARIIAQHLVNRKKIDAIKEFRSETGADLRDSKLLIDEFGTGPESGSKFLAAFT